MSITVRTDVFCDVCNCWVEGHCGVRQNSRLARKNARQNYGYRRIKQHGEQIDVCENCYDELNIEIDTSKD